MVLWFRTITLDNWSCINKREDWWLAVTFFLGVRDILLQHICEGTVTTHSTSYSIQREFHEEGKNCTFVTTSFAYPPQKHQHFEFTMDAAHVSEEMAAEKKKHNARPAWVNFATGAGAALSGWMFVHPFDPLKVLSYFP